MPPTPGDGELASGVPVTNLAGAAGDSQFFRIEVPAGATELTIDMAGAGDADLYVRFGQEPTLRRYDCRPYLDLTSDEQCSFTSPAAGTWYVRVEGYRPFADVSVLAEVEVPATEMLGNGMPVTGLAGGPGSSQYFSFELPEGATNLKVKLAGSGDADLYVNPGMTIGLDDYACRPYLDRTSNEQCGFANPMPGAWSVLVQGYRNYSDTMLTVSWDVEALLQPGVPSPAASGQRGDEVRFSFDVPAGAEDLVVTMAGSGDADLYVRFGNAPTVQRWDCRPYVDATSNEVCVFEAPSAGTWYVMARGWATFSNTTITHDYSFEIEPS